MSRLKPIVFVLLSMGIFAITAKSQEIMIIGGNNIAIDQAPWQVLFEINGEDQCGGAILTPEWILTAAHCICETAANTQNSRIIAGITLRSQKNNGQIRNIAEIIVHENYNCVAGNENFNNDIALIRLATPLNFNQNVQPIAFANNTDVNNGLLDPGEIGTITGWGWIDGLGNRSNNLQAATLPIISNQQAISLGSNVTVNMIPLFQQGVAASRGDSGGPMVVWRDGGFILGGICSWGHWPKEDNPTIYTRVSSYCNWITERIVGITGPDLVCTSDTYTLTNLPTGATVTGWSASPSGAVTFSGTGNSRTVSRSGSYNGEVTITANISTACGNLNVARKLFVGFPTIECLAYSNAIEPIDGDFPCPWEVGAVTYLCSTHPDNKLQIKTASPHSRYEVQIRSYPSLTVLYTQTVTSKHVTLNYTPWVPGWYNIRVRAINHSCGTGPWYEDDIEYKDCYSPLGGEETWKIYPNPASETLTVSIGNEPEQETMGSKASLPSFSAVLYDGQGRQFRQGESKDGSVQFDTGTLPNGTYFLHIYHDGQVEKRQVVIRH